MSHRPSGESTPPGNRHDMPTMAMVRPSAPAGSGSGSSTGRSALARGGAPRWRWRVDRPFGVKPLSGSLRVQPTSKYSVQRVRWMSLEASDGLRRHGTNGVNPLCSLRCRRTPRTCIDSGIHQARRRSGAMAFGAGSRHVHAAHRHTGVVLDAGLSDAARSVVGGKGRAVATMAGLGLPVPPAFCVTSDWCDECAANPAALVERMWQDVLGGLKLLEERTGRTFGAGPLPLL